METGASMEAYATFTAPGPHSTEAADAAVASNNGSGAVERETAMETQAVSATGQDYGSSELVSPFIQEPSPNGNQPVEDSLNTLPLEPSPSSIVSEQSVQPIPVESDFSHRTPELSPVAESPFDRVMRNRYGISYSEAQAYLDEQVNTGTIHPDDLQRILTEAAGKGNETLVIRTKELKDQQERYIREQQDRVREEQLRLEREEKVAVISGALTEGMGFSSNTDRDIVNQLAATEYQRLAADPNISNLSGEQLKAAVLHQLSDRENRNRLAGEYREKISQKKFNEKIAELMSQGFSQTEARRKAAEYAKKVREETLTSEEKQERENLRTTLKEIYAQRLRISGKRLDMEVIDGLTGYLSQRLDLQEKSVDDLKKQLGEDLEKEEEFQDYLLKLYKEQLYQKTYNQTAQELVQQGGLTQDYIDSKATQDAEVAVTQFEEKLHSGEIRKEALRHMAGEEVEGIIGFIIETLLPTIITEMSSSPRTR